MIILIYGLFGLFGFIGFKFVSSSPDILEKKAKSRIPDQRLFRSDTKQIEPHWVGQCRVKTA